MADAVLAQDTSKDFRPFRRRGSRFDFINLGVFNPHVAMYLLRLFRYLCLKYFVPLPFLEG